MINEKQFQEWYKEDTTRMNYSPYTKARRAWYEASELQQNKIDELQTAFEDCCIRKLSAEQHIERQQKKVNELENINNGLKLIFNKQSKYS